MSSKQLILNKKGFTLLESLLVLSIVSIMSFVLIINIVPIYHKKVIDTFLSQFEKDLMHAQQHAFVHEESVYLLFKPTEHQYKVEGNGLGESFFVRNYHSGVKINADNLSNRITFNIKGSIQRSGTIFISFKNKSYKVIFYLGKGRYKIEQL